jgi:hypothetical protein
MPISKLCIIAYRKDDILEGKSLRRLMQLYSGMMYGSPTKVDPDEPSAES